jgi:hypothetical protein
LHHNANENLKIISKNSGGEMKEVVEQYTADQIKVLEGLSAVRKDLQCILEILD